MNVAWIGEGALSEKARDLVAFDMASIRQTVAASHGHEPTGWLVLMEAYEKAGRILRDSPTPRLLAYAPQDGAVYATDGCNCCAMEARTAETKVDKPLLERLIAMTRE